MCISRNLCGLEGKEQDYAELPVVPWQVGIPGGNF